VAAVLLLVAAGSLALGLRGQRHPLAGPVGRQPAAPSGAGGGSSSSTAVSGPVVARSAPVSLRIPALSLAVPVSLLGLNANGTVQVPTDIEEPGWFQPGPSPGEVGSAVILGHVDSTRGEGVFFGLRTLRPGDPVQVTLTDGVVATFAVVTVVMYSKSQFPDQQVYGSHGDAALQLVTCGGTFDPQTGHYLSNIVVYTSFVSATPAPAPVTSPVAGTSAAARASHALV
jgi:hypothetical protein